MCGVTSTLDPNGRNTYRQIQSSNSATSPKGCIYVCVVYDSRNKQTLFPCIQHLSTVLLSGISLFSVRYDLDI